MAGGFEQRGYTRQEIGRMTLTDLRILASEHQPGTRPGLAPLDGPRTVADVEACRSALQARADDWSEY